MLRAPSDTLSGGPGLAGPVDFGDKCSAVGGSERRDCRLGPVPFTGGTGCRGLQTGIDRSQESSEELLFEVFGESCVSASHREVRGLVSVQVVRIEMSDVCGVGVVKLRADEPQQVVS